MVAIKTPVLETWAVTLESASPVVCACVESAWCTKYVKKVVRVDVGRCQKSSQRIKLCYEYIQEHVVRSFYRGASTSPIK